MEVKDLGLQVLLRESGRMTIGRAPDLESGLEAFKASPPGPVGGVGARPGAGALRAGLCRVVVERSRGRGSQPGCPRRGGRCWRPVSCCG